MRNAAAAGWKESKHGRAPNKKVKRSFSRCRETERVEERTKQADVQVDISFTSWTNREWASFPAASGTVENRVRPWRLSVEIWEDKGKMLQPGAALPTNLTAQQALSILSCFATTGNSIMRPTLFLMNDRLSKSQFDSLLSLAATPAYKWLLLQEEWHHASLKVTLIRNNASVSFFRMTSKISNIKRLKVEERCVCGMILILPTDLIKRM